MEHGLHSHWRSKSFYSLDNVDEDGDGNGNGGSLRMTSSFPMIHQPQTPKEPMEFLSRSWSLSASEISKALAQKQQKQFIFDKNPNLLLSPTETISSTQLVGTTIEPIHARKTGSIGKWFHHHKEIGISTVKKKDRARVENARIHSAVSIAGLATGLAAVAAAAAAAAEKIGNGINNDGWRLGSESDSASSKMRVALASATELLASHCIELAELAGGDSDRVGCVVKSAVDIHSPGDIMTLTAAAATALRGEAALRSRVPKEAKKNASISPCEKGIVETHWPSAAFHCKIEQHTNPPCVGELMQRSRKGVLRGKRVSVYVNKKSQIIIKLKSKHVGGAFSKRNKCVVYGVCDETAAWPYKKVRENSDENYFGLKTGQGLLEFKCKSKTDKQTWVEGIQNLLRQVNCLEATECNLKSLCINSAI